MHAEIGQTVHDVVNALSKVIVQILITGGGDSKERGAAGGRLVRLVSMAGGKGHISQVRILLYEARVSSVESVLLWRKTWVI